MPIDKNRIRALIACHGTLRFLTGSHIQQEVGNLAVAEGWSYPCNIGQNNPYIHAIVDEIICSHFIAPRRDGEKIAMRTGLQEILALTEWQETWLFSSGYGFDVRENEYDWQDDRKPLLHLLALRKGRTIVLWLFHDLCDPDADKLIADQELPPLPPYVAQDFDFDSTEIRPGERHVAAPGAVAELERELHCTLPSGYGDYIARFGRCALDHFVRIYLPDKIREYQQEWRERIDEFWLWDETPSSLDKDQALAGICIGDTVHGDELVIERSRPGIHVLPRSSYAVIPIGETLPRALHWLCCSGKLVYPAPHRAIFPF